MLLSLRAVTLLFLPLTTLAQRPFWSTHTSQDCSQVPDGVVGDNPETGGFTGFHNFIYQINYCHPVAQPDNFIVTETGNTGCVYGINQLYTADFTGQNRTRRMKIYSQPGCREENLIWGFGPFGTTEDGCLRPSLVGTNWDGLDLPARSLKIEEDESCAA